MRKNTQSLPSRAEALLTLIESRVRDQVPAGLTLDTNIGPAVLMNNRSGRQGVLSLHLRLFDRETLIAERNIGVGDDESVEITDYARTGAGGAKLTVTNLASLSDALSTFGLWAAYRAYRSEASPRRYWRWN
jgi:hypothetical protein